MTKPAWGQIHIDDAISDKLVAEPVYRWLPNRQRPPDKVAVVFAAGPDGECLTTECLTTAERTFFEGPAGELLEGVARHDDPGTLPPRWSFAKMKTTGPPVSLDQLGCKAHLDGVPIDQDA
ncbi:hypothetical protein E4U42_005236 [Claviceps africana]|uniref:Uncharacterized protein n=1 Tax=Claviceps africana TaxID=83212 RepID=A0A8K0J3U6_9HYPO|nr:hypothetical protein E4U42_005236 [Claviceps africana]